MEYLDLVDENDNVTGKVARDEAHEKNLRHRAIHILIFNNKNQVLSQFRSETQTTRPLHWSSSVGGHVSSGENPDDSAKRELKEELGISIPLTFVGKYKNHDEIDNEVIYLYYGNYDGKLVVDKGEIADIKWESMDYFLENKDNLTISPDFIKSLNLFKEKIN